ncbi:uncharacterized protein LOC108950429 [Ciona intestinalis]
MELKKCFSFISAIALVFIWMEFTVNNSEENRHFYAMSNATVIRVAEFKQTFQRNLKFMNKHSALSKNFHLQFGGISVHRQNKSSNDSNSTTLKSCPVKVNFGSSIKNPMIHLRNDRFLFVIVKNGPNNQLSSLRDAIFLCIMLNRTLVLPLMFKHKTDRQKRNGNVINIAHRVDLDALGRLIPFVTLDAFRQSCKGRINDVFRVKALTTSRYRGYEEMLNMTIDEFHHSTKRNRAYALPKFPLNKNLTKKSYFKLRATKEEVLKAYDSKSFDLITLSSDLSEITPTDLFSEIRRHTPHPLHIRQMASQYVDDVIKTRQFLFVHWRFDRPDFMRRCLHDNPWATPRWMKLCKEILSFRPQDVARAIANQTTKYGCSDVYIASPPTEAEFIRNVSNILRQNYHLQVFGDIDLVKYLDEYFSSCDWLSSNRNDIQSTIEMDIGTISKVFLSSDMSSWSKEVLFTRNASEPTYRILSAIRDVLRTEDSPT